MCMCVCVCACVWCVGVCECVCECVQMCVSHSHMPFPPPVFDCFAICKYVIEGLGDLVTCGRQLVDSI